MLICPEKNVTMKNNNIQKAPRFFLGGWDLDVKMH